MNFYVRIRARYPIQLCAAASIRATLIVWLLSLLLSARVFVTDCIGEANLHLHVNPHIDTLFAYTWTRTYTNIYIDEG